MDDDDEKLEEEEDREEGRPDLSPREIETHDESYYGGQILMFVELLWWPSNSYSGV